MTGLNDRPVRPEANKGPEPGLEAQVFSDGVVFAMLDGAANPKLLDYLYRLQPPFECLYRGELAPDMAHVAPYLAQLEEGSEFTTWILEQGWGKHWGLLAIAPCDLDTLRRHLRRFLTVHTEEGKPLLFRFYDPRVLRTYLPTCNAGELADFFGPVQAYVMEAESPDQFLRFELADGKLKQTTHSVKRKR